MDYVIYFIKVIVLALLQGVTELFPVSSLGHTIIIPDLLGWDSLLRSEDFQTVVFALHLGTAIALLIFFWRDWLALIRALFKTLVARRLDADPHGKTIWLVIVGAIPVGLLGLIFERKIDEIFFPVPYPVIPAVFLCLNGAALYAAEKLRQRAEPEGVSREKQEQTFKSIDDMSFLQAFLIGTLQATALIPGISRSGITMVGCMSAKLSHKEAARFAFLLATPVIAATALIEIPKLFDASKATIAAAAMGGVVACVAAFLSVKFLMRYFEVGRLTPFALYCIGAGLLVFAFFAPLVLR